MAKSKHHTEPTPENTPAPQEPLAEAPKQGVLVEVAPNKSGKDNPLVRVDAELTTADIVTVMISQKEGKFQKNLNDALRKVKRIEGDIKRKTGELEDQVKKSAIEDLMSKIGSVNDVLKAAGFSHRVAAHATVNTETREVYARVELERPEGGVKKTKQTVDTLSYEIKPFTDQQNAAADEIKDLTRQLTENRELVFAWKKELADMGRQERKARAKVVEHQLSQSQEGKDLLAKLAAVDPDDDHLLPLLPN
jgi:hypothetical protein